VESVGMVMMMLQPKPDSISKDGVLGERRSSMEDLGNEFSAG